MANPSPGGVVVPPQIGGPTDTQLDEAKDHLWDEFQGALGSWFTRPSVRQPDGNNRKHDHGEILRGNWAQYPARKAETERCMRLAGRFSRALMEFRRERDPSAPREVTEADIALAVDFVKRANAPAAAGQFQGVVC